MVSFFGLLNLGRAGTLDDVGFVHLAAEWGIETPSGAGISVVQVEASTTYMPDTNISEFSNITFTNLSDTNMALSFSPHATSVGRKYYGSITSMAKGITEVGVYSVADYTGMGFLAPRLPYLDKRAPKVEEADVQSHSWVGGSSSSVDLLRRLDYAIDRDGFTCVVGLGNSAGAIPVLLASGYHSIAVGRTDGNHSSGKTLFDGAGRCKPDIVVPESTTSDATPVVAAAAVLLLDHAATPSLEAAAAPQGIKALLLAGATKEEWADWSRTEASPLDSRYGAGELNIYESLLILDAGAVAPSTNSYAALRGWQVATVNAAAPSQYFFEVPEGYVLLRFSVVATWHRIIGNATTKPPEYKEFLPVVDGFADVDLMFSEASGFVAGALVDQSVSQVDNVEHIWQPILPAGNYLLSVGTDTNVLCGLAWRGRLVKVPQDPSISVDTSGVVFGAFDVSSNQLYRVESTDELSTTSVWSEVVMSQSVSNILEWVDESATNVQRRYYRFDVIP